MKIVAAIALSVAFVLSANLQSSDVKVRIKGVHLCCGACVAGVDDALEEVKDISDVAADRNGKVVVFTAKDAKVAEAGIKALAEAGYYGRAAVGDKDVKFPATGVKKDTKTNSIVLGNVHLCCGSCVTDAQKALEKVEGLNQIAIDRNEETITLKGKSIDVNKAIGALNNAGFYAKPAKKKKEPKDD